MCLSVHDSCKRSGAKRIGQFEISIGEIGLPKRFLGLGSCPNHVHGRNVFSGEGIASIADQQARLTDTGTQKAPG